MKKTHSESRVGIGISSVLMILVVLAMTALSMLACTDARSTYQMTRRNVEVSTAGYTASLEAQRLLAAIDQAVYDQPDPCPDPLAWLEQNAPEEIQWSQQEGRCTFQFTVPGAEGHSLQVEGYVTDGLPRTAITRYCLAAESTDFEEPGMSLMGQP